MTTSITAIVPQPRTLTALGRARRLDGTVLRMAGIDHLVADIAALAARCGGPTVAVAALANADVVVHIVPGWRPALPGHAPIGLSPSGPADGDCWEESYAVGTDGDRLTIHASSDQGAFRAATAVLQAIGPVDDGPVDLPLFHAADAPALRWRGLMLDVARHFFPIAELEAVIDLLAYYRLNVLHLHLTDTQAWRLRMPGWPALTPDGAGSYSAGEIADLVRYAARRQVILLPEIDMPGHVLAALSAYPNLAGDRPPAHPALGHLRPGVAAAVHFARQAIDLLCDLCPTPYVHVGGDEAFGMDPTEYAQFMRLVHGWVRDNGKLPVAWQEASRARAFGTGDVLQQWISSQDAPRPQDIDRMLPPEYAFLRDAVLETFRAAPGDLPRAVDDGAHLLLSQSFPFYLDRRYGEASLDPGQADLMSRLGHAGYPAYPTSEFYRWRPSDIPAVVDGTAQVAGAQAAIWAESITCLDDLATLLLPRLPVLAEVMWAPDRTSWPDVAGRIRVHTPVWCRLGLSAYYRSAEVFG